jgi:hypothetical protein
MKNYVNSDWATIRKQKASDSLFPSKENVLLPDCGKMMISVKRDWKAIHKQKVSISLFCFKKNLDFPDETKTKGA